MEQDFRIRVAMESPALDRLVEIVGGLLDFSWQRSDEGDWSVEWGKAQASAGPSRHNKALTRMARELAEVDREMEWFPPPSRIPKSIHLRNILKVLRIWLIEGIPGECFSWFMQIGLVDVETRWPDELKKACAHWGSERAAAINYIEWLRESDRTRTHAIHGEWPVPPDWMPDDLVEVAYAVTVAVYLGDVVPVTAKYQATAPEGRPEAAVLGQVVEGLRHGVAAEELIRELAADGVTVSRVNRD